MVSFELEQPLDCNTKHNSDWPCVPSVAPSDTSCKNLLASDPHTAFRQPPQLQLHLTTLTAAHCSGAAGAAAGSGRSFTAYIFAKGAVPVHLAGAERCKAAAAQPPRQAAEAGGPAQEWATAPMPDVPAQHDALRQRLLPSPGQLASRPSPGGAGPAVAAAAAVATCMTEGAVAGSTVVVSATAAVSVAPASATPAQRRGGRGTGRQRNAEAAAEGGRIGRRQAARTSPGVVRQTRASTARLRLAQQGEPHMG